MTTPTSVSSRFNTKPVTPLPRSIISLSMASVRPSSLATPSPSSRMMPTFCLAAAVFAPAICASVSCNRSAIGYLASKTLLQRLQPAAHAAVIHIAAHLDAHPADQRRAVGEGGAESGAIPALETGLYVSLQIRRQGRGALDGGCVPGEVECHQPPKMRKDGRTITVTGSDEVLHHVPDAVLIEQAVHQTIAEQLLGLAFRLFVDFHGYSTTCLAASSARRR